MRRVTSGEDLLGHLLQVPGVIGVALVDAVTGLTYSEAGSQRIDGDDCCQLATAIGDRLHLANAEGELESLVITAARHIIIMRALASRGTSLLLVAVLERQRTNLALALHQIDLHRLRESA
ncbi:hypothetical protein AB0F46_40090 [Streptomyces sp. NPDC026665]|uniref:hypothetical protein n=1 Tax=Streptomyces sp. NPDC026665 TaxID=3154798 RepID=UPI0033D0016B